MSQLMRVLDRRRTLGRILVVEDEIGVRTLAVDALRHAGHFVVEAAGDEQAVAMLRSDLPLDLLFTDIAMPGGMDGFLLAEAAVALRPGILIAYTSGALGRSQVAQGRIVFGPFLAKPWRPAQLCGLIEELLLGGREAEDRLPDAGHPWSALR
jgi:CheY-like chemotaxis protein